MKRFASVAGLLVIVASCTDGPTTPLSESPLYSISDGAHENGNEHFFWLPPMVSNPTYAGVFDASLSPVVQVCEWDGASCASPLLAEFTTTNGPGSERVRVVPEDEHYIVNWHTSDFDLDPAKTYRIIASVDGQDLGHADVDVVSKGSELKNVNTNEFIALKDGRTLPIKFRVEDGALATCGPVPEAFQNVETYDGRTFAETLAALSWEDAATLATDFCGHLVTLTSQAENDFVRANYHVGSRPPNKWIGLSDIAVDGTFEWVTGEPLVFTNWSPGEPSGVRNGTVIEDCAELYDNNPGRWNDFSCGDLRTAIVEWESIYDPTAPNPDD